MTNGRNIRAVDGTSAAGQQETNDEALELDQFAGGDAYPDAEAADWDEPQTGSRRWYDYILPALFVATIAAWTAFYGWVHRPDILAGGTPEQWSGWISQWAIPVLLVVALWLLAMRLSAREAARFGDAAQALSAEARSLENRLTVVNRELSLAREFLAEQSRELDFLGRTATDRISAHAGKLQGLIHDNGAQVDAIATVSQSALENMDRLRDDLPVIANSARDVSNRIGGAGREAHSQLNELIAGFERLNDFGQASESQVVSLQERIGKALGAFETQANALEAIADTRFSALREKSEEFRAELAGREVEALAAIRNRAAKLAEEIGQARTALEEEEEEAIKSLRSRLLALREESGQISRNVREGEDAAIEAWNGQAQSVRERLATIVEEIQQLDATALENAQAKLAALKEEAQRVDANLAERNRKFLEELDLRNRNFASSEAEAIAALGLQMAELDAGIAQRREAHVASATELAERGEVISHRLEELGAALASATSSIAHADSALESGAEGLNARLAESQVKVAEAQIAVDGLTEASIRLLELIHAGSEHSKSELIQALAAAETRMGEVEQRGESLRLVLDASEEKGKSLSDYVIRAKDASEETATQIDRLHERFMQSNREHQGELARLQEGLVALEQQSGKIASRNQDELKGAIAALEEAARQVSETLMGTSHEGIAALAESLGEQSAQAIGKALNARSQEAIAELERAAERATSASRDAAGQLRNQLGKVDELAGNLENRVARARERAEEQVGNDFARRMAMITESLNSASIDIAKALSADVADTSWTSYLKGDRGIFTRRAVKLLDTVELRDIAEIYDRDPEFRDNVSHYIADFEGMLRTMLSTRDGNALGVTLLGSDMGKLYVALAQAIERLRS